MDILNSLQSIGFDWRLGIAHLINFLIVVGLLRYFLFDPLKERLQDRRQTVKKGVEDAKAAERARFEAEDEAQDVIAAAKEEKKEILAEAREHGEEVKERLRGEAKTQVAEMRERAEAKLAAERERMTRELEGQVGELAVLAAEKIIAREVGESDHDRLVAELIDTTENA